MTDVPRNEPAREKGASSPPAAQGAPQAQAADDFNADEIRDLLLTEDSADEPRADAAPAAPAPAEQRPIQVAHGLQDLIQKERRLEGQINTLEEKLMNIERYYADKKGNYDPIAHERDRIRLGQLEREYAKIQRTATQVEGAQARWSNWAEGAAVNLLRGNMQGVPKNMRDAVKRSFAASFRQLRTAGWLAQASNQNESTIRETLMMLFDRAVGETVRSTRGRTSSMTERERGLDDLNEESPAPPPDDGFGDDSLAREYFERAMKAGQKNSRTLGDRLREMHKAGGK